MKLEQVTIENYRAIDKLDVPLDSALTVLHGPNGHGKTSVLSAIATGLGSIPRLLPDISSVGFRKNDRRGQRPLRVTLRTSDGVEWDRRRLAQRGTTGTRALSNVRMLKAAMEEIVTADLEGAEPLDLPIVAFYDTDRAVSDALSPVRNSKTAFRVTPRWKEHLLIVAPVSCSSSSGSTSGKMKSCENKRNGRISTIG